MRGNAWKMVVAVNLFGALTAGGVAEAAGAGEEERGRLVQRLKDPASGGEVRVYTGAAGVTVEVADAHVRVVKTLRETGSETTVDSGNEQVRLKLDRSGFVVTTADEVTWQPGRDRAAAEQTRDRLLRSPAMKRAFSLLDRVTVPATTPVAPLVWGVKVVVHAAMGDGRAFTRVPRLARSQPGRTALLPVGLQDHGPGWCWDEYTKEAIKAQLEVEDCLRGLKWYDFFGDDACWLIFEMRALGAFAWWVKCVGFSI
jgi:hypothetical protein